MAAKDHHIALRTDVLDKINAGYIEIVLAKLQWGKDDVAFTLHVNPSAFTSGPERPIGSDFWGSRRTRNASFRMRADASARKYRKGTISSDLPRHLTRDSASSRRLRRVSKHAAFGCPEDGNYRPGGALSAKN